MKAIVEKKVTVVSLDRYKIGWRYEESETSRTVTILLFGIPVFRYSFKRDISKE